MNEDRAILLLIDRVAERIGYRAEAIPYASAVKALKSRFPRGLTHVELERRAEEGDVEVERALLEAVSVGETFFFRQPDQFRYLAESYAPKLVGREVVRAWSAGCASGEETYSLAACLVASLSASSTRLHILGTDVAERNVLAAVRGVYGGWSVREAGPMLHPIFGPTTELGSFSVSDAVRAVTSFRTHNVLEEPPAPGMFDIVFCRNVLLYFSDEAVEAACARIVSALVPGGLVAFGTLDVGRAPPGTEPVGPRGANLFMKTHAVRRTRAPRRSLRASGRSARKDGAPDSTPRVVLPKALPPPVIVEPPEMKWIEQHLTALASIEQGDLGRAEKQLEALRAHAPTYLPAIFELGVLSAKRNQRAKAESLMRELLRRTEGKDPHEPVPGPEELTIAYYRVAAEAYLGFAPGGR